jgi:hypothetical protein
MEAEGEITMRGVAVTEWLKKRLFVEFHGKGNGLIESNG